VRFVCTPKVVYICHTPVANRRVAYVYDFRGTDLLHGRILDCSSISDGNSHGIVDIGIAAAVVGLFELVRFTV